MKKFFLLIIISIIFFSNSCKDSPKTLGLYWEQSTLQIHPNGDSSIIFQKHYLIPNKYKREMSSYVGNNFIIIRMDKDIMIRGNIDDSTYTEVPFSEIEKRNNIHKENIRRMRAQMDTLSPRLRAFMEMDMGVRWIPENYKLVETGEKQKILKLNCEKFLITDNDSLIGEYWLTNDLGNMNDYSKDWIAILEKVLTGTAFDRYKLLYERGILIKSQTRRATIEIQKIEKTDIPENLFDPPSDYTKLEYKVRQ